MTLGNLSKRQKDGKNKKSKTTKVEKNELKQERKEAHMRYNNQLLEILEKQHINNGGDKRIERERKKENFQISKGKWNKLLI